MQKKLNIIEKKAQTLKSAKQSNAYEIVAYLDLFEGKISYSELMNMPMPILRDLVDAKHAYDEDKVKAAQKRSDEIAKQQAKENERIKNQQRSKARRSSRPRRS